jgi:hypothetical protein
LKPKLIHFLLNCWATGEKIMRSFVAACFIAAVIAAGAAAALDAFVQQSSSAAFAEGSVRL